MNKFIKYFLLISPLFTLFSCSGYGPRPTGKLSRDEAANYIKTYFTEGARMPKEGKISWDYHTCTDPLPLNYAFMGIIINYTYFDDDASMFIKSNNKSNEPLSIPKSTEGFYNELVDDREVTDHGTVYISMNGRYFGYLEKNLVYEHSYEAVDNQLIITSKSVTELGTESILIHTYNERGHETNFKELVSNPELLLNYSVNIDFTY